MSGDQPKVKVTIDGKEIQVEAGLPLIEAAQRVGADIPHFCYHSHLSIAGNCRMCVVEVENVRGLPISCATPAAEGMIVKTDTDRVKAQRASVMEFLLVNHPIDCPICDQAGECKLQVYYMAHDQRDSRLEVDKVHYQKRVPVGPEVLLDQERCVECTRCIRFCDEVTQTGELRMANRGDRSVITTFPGYPLSNHYSVNTADICPVGALTQRDFRFKARVWFLKEADTICPGCSRGCNVKVDYGWHAIVTDYNGKAYRLRPRVNDHVNKAWMCDFGRQEYHRVNDDRLTAARVLDEELPVRGVMTQAAAALRAAGEVLIVGSLEGTFEELFLLKLLAEQLGGTAVCVPDREDGLEDDFLIRADKHPNRGGAEWLEMLRSPSDLPALLSGARAVLIHRADLLAFDGDGSIAAALGELETRVVVSATENRVTRLASHLLPGCSFLEKEGHWVNCDGRVQRIRRGRHMKVWPGALDDVEILAGLGVGLPTQARSVFDALVASHPRLAGLTWTSAGDLGVVPDADLQGAST